MGITQPYRSACRQFVDGSFAEGGRWGYVMHPKYAESPEQYIRAFSLLQEDIHRIFQYVEPSDNNLTCYSYRIHEMLLRACIEVEANCKAILKENGYAKAGDWDMRDYRKVESSHRLSSYRVKLPVWHGNNNIRQPFASWATNAQLPWYNAYNITKHDRHLNFPKATFEHLIDAVCGVLVLLSAQFWTHDFGPGSWLLAMEGPNDGMESAIGSYFRIQFPHDWPLEERYDFKWQDLETLEDPFIDFPYP